MEATVRHGVSRNLREQYRLLKKPPERRTAEELRMIATTLVGVSFFERLDPAVRLQCCGVLRHQTLKADRTVFEEGDVGTLFYVVLEGEVGVFIRDVPADELQHSNNLEEMRRKRACERRKAQQGRLKQRLSLALSRGSVHVSKRIFGGISRWRDRCRHSSTGVDDTDSGGFLDVVHQVGFAPEVNDSDAGSGSEADTESATETESEEYEPVETGSADEPAPLKEVAILRQGMAFGEIALENDQPRTATVRTKTCAHFAVLERADYQSILTHAFEQERRERLEFLASTPLLARTPIEELAKISPMLHQRDLRKNDVVYEAGSDTLQVYFVRHGEFAVRRPVEDNSARTSNTPAAKSSTGGATVADHAETMPASSMARSRRPTAFGRPTLVTDSDAGTVSAAAAPSRRGTVAARGSICTTRKSFAATGVAALVAAAGAFAANADEIRSSRRNSRVHPPGEGLRSTFCRRRSQWCTVTLVTPPQVFGLADYLCGSRVHCDRVVCQSSKGCVYGILAKELMSHLDAETRARMMRGASAHDQFVKRRTHVLSQLALTSRSSADGSCNVYSPEGRLRAITAALEKLSEEEERETSVVSTVPQAAPDENSLIAPSLRARGPRWTLSASASGTLPNFGHLPSHDAAVAAVPPVGLRGDLLQSAARFTTALRAPQLRNTWHLEEQLENGGSTSSATHRRNADMESRISALHHSSLGHGTAGCTRRTLQLPGLCGDHAADREDTSRAGVPDYEAGSLTEKKQGGRRSEQELKDMDPVWFPLFRKSCLQQVRPTHCASKAPPGQITELCPQDHHRNNQPDTQRAFEAGLSIASSAALPLQRCVPRTPGQDLLPGRAPGNARDSSSSSSSLPMAAQEAVRLRRPGTPFALEAGLAIVSSQTFGLSIAAMDRSLAAGRPGRDVTQEQQPEESAQTSNLPRLLGRRFCSGKAAAEEKEKPPLADGDSPVSCTTGAREGKKIYVVGNQIEVWSNSSKVWCRGNVEKVEDNQAVLLFKLPCGSPARKVVDISAKTAGVVLPQPSAGATAAAIMLRELGAASGAHPGGISLRDLSADLFSEDVLASAPHRHRDSLTVQNGRALAEPLERRMKRSKLEISMEEVVDAKSIYTLGSAKRPRP